MKPDIDLAEHGREAAVTLLNVLLPIDRFTPFVNGATQSWLQRVVGCVNPVEGIKP